MGSEPSTRGSDPKDARTGEGEGVEHQDSSYAGPPSSPTYRCPSEEASPNGHPIRRLQIHLRDLVTDDRDRTCDFEHAGPEERKGRRDEGYSQGRETNVGYEARHGG